MHDKLFFFVLCVMQGTYLSWMAIEQSISTTAICLGAAAVTAVAQATNIATIKLGDEDEATRS